MTKQEKWLIRTMISDWFFMAKEFRTRALVSQQENKIKFEAMAETLEKCVNELNQLIKRK